MAATVATIESLLLSFSSATDTLGVPLLKEIKNVWEEQKHHIPSLQDPPGIELIGHLNKGGVRLSVLRCARGSTSLESFRLHLARFVPGTAASAVNFQAFLVDGLTRWNSARATAAIHTSQKDIQRSLQVQSQRPEPNDSREASFSIAHHRIRESCLELNTCTSRWGASAVSSREGTEPGD